MKEIDFNLPAEERMVQYLLKIATGPKMSKDLTEAEALDGLELVLEGAVSPVRAGLFLIAARMKRETLEENLGFWRALETHTHMWPVRLKRLLQVADAFDGFQRVPYFGFYTLPVLAELGLPAYGHSSLPQPPKFGITFEDLLVNHYGVPADQTLEQRATAIETHGFGYLSTRQSHPQLHALNDLRREIVKRPMLATFEKMLRPLQAESNLLATNYFHPGYEEPMLAVAALSGIDRTVIGNGMEGTTLYGVHKAAKLFIHSKAGGLEERALAYEQVYDDATAGRIRDAFNALKETVITRETLAELGEQALRDGTGPAAPLIAHHTATLGHLFDVFESCAEGYSEADSILKQGGGFQRWRGYMDSMQI